MSRNTKHEVAKVVTIPLSATELALDGEVTVFTVVELKDRLLTALDEGNRLELDLSNVADFDGAGLQLLLALDREAVQAGKTVRLVSPSIEVQEALDLCCLRQAFSGGIGAGEDLELAGV